MRNRVFGFIVCFFMASALIFAEKPPEGEGWNYFSKAKNSVQGWDISLLPIFDQTNDILSDLRINEPVMSIELYYTMPLPDTNGQPMMDFLFTRLQEISTMEGIQYYSANKDAMTLYLERCFLVEQAGRKRVVEDPDFTVHPDRWDSIVYQKDTTFGNNWYSLNMIVSDDAIRMKLSNVESMKYFIFPIMSPGGVVIELVIIPGEQELQFYALSQLEVSVKEILGKKIYLPGVFDHRVSSYQSWIASRIYDNPTPGQISK